MPDFEKEQGVIKYSRGCYERRTLTGSDELLDKMTLILSMKQEIKMDKEIFGIVGDEALKNRAARFDGTLRKYSGVSSGVEEEKLVLSFL